ncbi:MAG TPA: NAD(P)/FAD-dependent oxidoreductase [Paracoccaceae bacterium]|nr:NAD(P)/FAD-dependent oxidoreductase [Paracoccaceae bacterium]
MKSWDAIVIGAGHNGLVAACYLARAGLDVLVLEKNPWVGGAATSRELYPGVTYSNCAYVCSLFRPEIVADLELPRFGLQIIGYEGGGVFTEGGDCLVAYGDREAHRREFARFSARDAEAYERVVRDVTRQARLIQPFLLRSPPDPVRLRPRDLGEFLFLARRLRGLSAREMAETVRFWTLSVADFLDLYFEHPLVKASLASGGIIGTALGPMSPGTAYVLLQHYMGEVDGAVGAWGYARGGMGAVTRALADSLKASGGEIRTGAEVERVLLRGGRAEGVVLAGGEEIRARRVLSNADVRRTLLGLVGEQALPEGFAEKVRRVKMRGSSGKVNLALDGLPEFPALPEGCPAIRGDLHFTDSILRMERAYDDWKAGRWSADPFLDAMIPTILDPTMAVPGRHFMSCFVQYCPYELEGRGWTEQDRDGFAASVIGQIAEHSPGFRDRILHMEVRTPRELEAEVGLTEGNIFQGELTFDQILFNRPIPGWAEYRTPIPGLWLCGASTHPGGGVMGARGRNAAFEILRAVRARRDHVSEAHAAIGLRRQGAEEVREFLRMVLMPVADIAEESLGDDRLRGLIAFDATLGRSAGPRAPTTYLGLLYRLTGEWDGVAGAEALPPGGPGTVTQALEAAARAMGVEIRTGAEAVRILVEGERVAGVDLGRGGAERAPVVLAAIAPQAALLDLLGPALLGSETVRALRAIRACGAAAKLNLALDGVPEFRGIGLPRGRVVLAPSVGHVERASNAVKHGEAPEEPVLEAVVMAEGLAPEGAAVLSAIVQFVPREPPSREKLIAACLGLLERHAPGLGRMVRHAELLTPADLEARYRMPGGHWHHGELAPDQMFWLRPAFGLARYRGPVPGLWLCGAGTHPGGGVSGISGLNAARAIAGAAP